MEILDHNSKIFCINKLILNDEINTVRLNNILLDYPYIPYEIAYSVFVTPMVRPVPVSAQVVISGKDVEIQIEMQDTHPQRCQIMLVYSKQNIV